MAKNSDRLMVRGVLKNLPHAERGKIVQESLGGALARMPADESRQIEDLAKRLAGKTNKLGPVAAIEILAAIGMLWSENRNGHRK